MENELTVGIVTLNNNLKWKSENVFLKKVYATVVNFKKNDV